ncbi:hypothetical protein I4U23_016750 [Adineta vaga]|nr:hypothetical protein I4U23_016750 [Adineta vaga]
MGVQSSKRLVLTYKTNADENIRLVHEYKDQNTIKNLHLILRQQPCIGFIQNIIEIRHRELLLRMNKVNIKDQLSVVLNNKKLSCPNIFYGDIATNNNNIFIKPEAIIEKIIHVYNKRLKCYIYCRVPNLSDLELLATPKSQDSQPFSNLHDKQIFYLTIELTNTDFIGNSITAQENLID